VEPKSKEQQSAITNMGALCDMQIQQVGKIKLLIQNQVATWKVDKKPGADGSREES
jgi:hypothetical protein